MKKLTNKYNIKIFFILFLTSCIKDIDTEENNSIKNNSDLSNDSVTDSYNDNSSDKNYENNIKCLNGEKRNCHMIISKDNGIITCFVGFQYCINNKWSNCSK